MTDRPTNEEREALIAGGHAGALEPDEAAELALLADLLADPSTWAEPSRGPRGRSRAGGRRERGARVGDPDPVVTGPRADVATATGACHRHRRGRCVAIAIVVGVVLVTRRWHRSRLRRPA